MTRLAAPKSSRHIRLACADFTFPLLPHGRALDLIAMLEFGGVDIGLFEKRSHLWPSREYRRPLGSGRALARRLRDRGLAASDVFLQLDPDPAPFAINHPEPKRRKHARESFLRTLDYAGALGCPHVTTLPGMNFPEIERAGDSWKRALAELSWRIEKAAAYPLVFAVEPHIGSFAATPARAKNLADSLPELTLTLDYTHFARAGFPDEAVHPLLSRASHLHVRGARRGRLQTIFQENVIDYRQIVRRTAAAGYRGWFGIEYVWTAWQNCNRCDNLSETLQFRDYLRSEFAAITQPSGT